MNNSKDQMNKRSSDEYLSTLSFPPPHHRGREEEEPWVDDGDQEGYGQHHQRQLHKVQHVDGHGLVDERQVLGKAVLHAAHGVGVEEADGRVHNPGERPVVQVVRDLHGEQVGEGGRERG